MCTCLWESVHVHSQWDLEWRNQWIYSVIPWHARTNMKDVRMKQSTVYHKIYWIHNLRWFNNKECNRNSELPHTCSTLWAPRTRECVEKAYYVYRATKGAFQFLSGKWESETALSVDADSYGCAIDALKRGVLAVLYRLINRVSSLIRQRDSFWLYETNSWKTAE